MPIFHVTMRPENMIFCMFVLETIVYLCHYITQWFNFLFKILQLLIDHCTEYPFDLTFLSLKDINSVQTYEN